MREFIFTPPQPGNDHRFENAVAFLIFHLEKGYNNDPDDTGGETKFGISKARFPKVNIKKLTLEQAVELYRVHFWQEYRCNAMPWPIAFMLFDCMVNHNPVNPAKWLQRALGVTPDGIIGPRTVAAARAATDPAGVAGEMTKWRIQYVKNLRKYWKYGRGWHNRHVDALTFALRYWHVYAGRKDHE